MIGGRVNRDSGNGRERGAGTVEAAVLAGCEEVTAMPQRRVRSDVDHALELRAQGWSVQQIAAELGVGAATLHRALGAANVER